MLGIFDALVGGLMRTYLAVVLMGALGARDRWITVKDAQSPSPHFITVRGGYGESSGSCRQDRSAYDRVQKVILRNEE